MNTAARPSVAERLRETFGEQTPFELLGEDFDHGVDRVAEKAGIAEEERAELLEVLASRAHEALPAKEGDTWLQRHAFDLLLIFGFLSIVLLSARAVALHWG